MTLGSLKEIDTALCEPDDDLKRGWECFDIDNSKMVSSEHFDVIKGNSTLTLIGGKVSVEIDDCEREDVDGRKVLDCRGSNGK